MANGSAGETRSHSPLTIHHSPAERAELSNYDFLEALRHLAFIRKDKILRPVDYKNLGSEEFGGVYESFLALTPQISSDGARFTFAEFAGNERKTSGSYYTPSDLVELVLDTALDPVLDDAERTAHERGRTVEQALLGHHLAARLAGDHGGLSESRLGWFGPLGDPLEHHLTGLEAVAVRVDEARGEEARRLRLVELGQGRRSADADADDGVLVEAPLLHGANGAQHTLGGQELLITDGGGRVAFLGSRIPFRAARVVDAVDGRELGEVDALEMVTLGQRRGIGLVGGGPKRYVVDIDHASATVSVGDESLLLCDSIAVWYLMPEVLSRPVIVNLWGMTGVGKTDLVRRLVSILDIQEHFVEIEMSNGDTTTWHSSVASRLSDSGALSGEPTLLLFDEIQRFNTLNPDGSPVTNTKFSDFWELLSDGRLSRRESPDVEYLMASLYQNQAAVERRRAEGETVVDDTIGVWEGQQLKRQYGIPGELEELTQLTYAQAVELMKNVRRTKRIYEPIDCSRCLIVISGNLDEAFTMATAGAEADIDADIFAAFTDKITVVDIKRALVRRFKPEQVARFGNIHLIYSSLRRCDFEVLIRREIGRVIDSTQRTTGVTVSVGDAVAELIYRNGVFPVQGVRPVFSSVIDILETNLAKLIFRAVMDDEQRVTIDWSVELSDQRRLPMFRPVEA